MRCPSGVGLSLRVVRKNNWVPNSLSSNAIRLLTAGWPMPSSLAATEKLPPSSERTKARKQSIRSIQSFPLGIDHILSIPFFLDKFAARLQPTTGGQLPNNLWGGGHETAHRDRRGRHRRLAPGPVSSEARRRRDADHRPRAGRVSRHPSLEHGRAPPCDDRARRLSRRQSLERPEASLLLPRSLFQFPAADLLPWLLLAAEPRRRLPDLSAGADEGFCGSWRQDRIPPHRGGRYRAAGQPVRSAGCFQRQGPARPTLRLPAGALALFAAAAAALRRPLYRRSRAGSDECDAFGFAGPRRDDRDSHDHL